VRRDRGIGTAEQFGLELTGKEPDGGHCERHKTGLCPTCTSPFAGEGARHQQSRDRDQTRNRQSADDTKLPVLRPEERAEAG
jgi:hypothetical protein